MAEVAEEVEEPEEADNWDSTHLNFVKVHSVEVPEVQSLVEAPIE